MLRKTLLLFTLTCGLAGTVFSQDECAQWRKKVVKMPASYDPEAIKAFETDLYTIYRCSGFDSTEVQLLLTSPLMNDLLVELANARDREITWGDWLESMQRFRQSEEFSRLYNLTVKIEALLFRKADLSAWHSDSTLLTEAGMPVDIVKEVRRQIEKDTTGTHTFAEVIESVKAQLKAAAPVVESSDKPNPSEAYTLSRMFASFMDYEQGLRMAATRKLPLLVYFNGHGSVNARKMEDKVLSDPKVGAYIVEHFAAICLYIDDKTPLTPPEQYESETGAKVRTVGDRNADVQITKFSNTALPYFYIVNSKGEKLGEIGYGFNKSLFLQFLEAGVAAYGK